jgi:hypothetical protein
LAAHGRSASGHRRLAHAEIDLPLLRPAYAGLLSAAGLGFLVSARNLLLVTAVFLILALIALAFRARQRRGYGPAVIGLIASAAIIAAKFYLNSPAMIYAAVGTLFAASMWNSWPARAKEAPCPQCTVPAELLKEGQL